MALAFAGVLLLTLTGATPAAAAAPCQVSANAVNGPGGIDLVGGKSLSTPLSIRITCDRPVQLSVRPPGGQATTHHFAPLVQRSIEDASAYICHGQNARVVVVARELNWSTSVSIAGLNSLPQCDVLLREGSTWVNWTGPRIAMRDAFAGRALGWLDWERGPEGLVPGLTAWSLVPRASPLILGWGESVPQVLSGLSHLVPGRSYLFISDRDRAWTFPRPPSRQSVFENAQVVSFYGHPNVPAMGVLGHGPPDAIADEIAVWAARYDALNGPRAVIPAFHLITGVAQAYPTPDGTWLYRLSREGISAYVEAARERGMLLFLDVQIGWSDPLREVKLLEEFLREPFVHMAIDPEFATQAWGVRPGLVIGGVSAEQINAVQHYLAGIARTEAIPPKILMVHQFAPHMIEDRAAIEDVDDVEISIDMDGFGGIEIKLRHYDWFALPAPSERPALKLFFDQDTPVMTPEQVQAIARRPDLIMYQ